MVVSEGAINNIMGGMENTAGVRLHSHRHKLKQRFDIVRKLGQGTYGKVQLAVNKETGQEVAIKTIKKAKIETEQDLVRIRREIQIMSSVQHPQIIHIYEVFENREKMVLVMEYAAGGELYDYLSERKVLPEPEARRVFRQVATAVYYCHKHKICHRDLKLENILLDLDGNAKIADFGLSNVFDEKQRLDTFCGSPLYASPEIVKGVPYVGPEVDCWSLGVLLYTLVYGAMPFDGSNFRRLVKQITQGDFYEPSTPATASELIRHMLTVGASERATIEDICSHWWVNEGYAESCLTEAEAMASQTPVRLDLLLSLAPKQISSEHMLIQPEDEDISQKSESERAPPNLKLPPPPALPEEETPNGVVPIRSHSLGAVPPPGGVNVDLLIEKKKKEKREKKESSSKKPPSRPSATEEEKKAKKEEKGEGEEKKKVKKRDPSVEGEREKAKKREASTERKTSVKKRESSLTRKTSAKRKENEAIEPEGSGVAPAPEKVPSMEPEVSQPVSTPKEPLPKAGSTKSVSKPTPITETDSYSARKSSTTVSPSKPKEVSPKEKTVVKEDEKDTEAILKETAAKIEAVESLMRKSEEEREEIVTSPPVTSPITSPPVTSPPVVSPTTSMQNSVSSSQVPSPVRSRTGSESSTDAQRQSRSECSSRRQSKIFSKAALFDPALAASKSPPPPTDRSSKRVGRLGALNMTDLAKRFEEKPSAGADKKGKVVAPFKVSDARKAFESRTDSKSLSESVSPKRKASVGSSSGDSGVASPKELVVTPTSPTKEDKPSVVPSTSTTAAAKIANKTSRESSPVKKVSKSPSKESPSASSSALKKKERSPTYVPPSQKKERSPKKESSPVKQVSKGVSAPRPKEEKLSSDKVSKVEPKAPAVTPSSSSKESLSSRQLKDSDSSIKSTDARVKRGTTPQHDTPLDSSDSESEAEKMLKELSVKREKLEIAKKEKLKKVSEGKEITPPSTKEETQGVKKPTTTSPVSPDEQKYATLPRGFRAKPEQPKTSRPKIPTDDSEDDIVWSISSLGYKSGDESPSSPTTTPTKEPSVVVRPRRVVKEVIPIPPEQVLAPTPRSPQNEKREIVSTSYIPKMNSFDESNSSDSFRKKSQMEIVLNNQQNRQPPAKRSSFAEIHISAPSSTRDEKSKPEFRTEVQHNVAPPDGSALPEPHLQRARRERIIPIMLEDDLSIEGGDSDDFKRVPTKTQRSTALQPSSSSSSKTSSVSSAPRTSGFRGAPIPTTVTALSAEKKSQATASPETIQKSRRERIIPIAVEGEGFVTPPVTETTNTEKVRPFQRQGSAQGSFSHDEKRERKRRRERCSLSPIGSHPGFLPSSTTFSEETSRERRRGRRSRSRGRGFTLDRAESFSSAGEDDDDEEDDGFQILTAESLFSTLLARVRSLTRKMATDEGGRTGPGSVGGGGADRMRRPPQSAANSDSSSSPSAGFWSSLYSPPRDLPGSRRVSDTSSRGHSRDDDPFESFGPPLWGRSTSRDASETESVFSEPSTFSTLPRGWRTRRSGREESVVEGDDGFASFTPSRRQFYSRTLSRDLPPLNNDGENTKLHSNRNSWDASSSSGTLPRSSQAAGPALPTKFSQEPASGVATLYGNFSQNTFIPSPGTLGSTGSRERPLSTAGSSSSSSGEATGRVGGHYEQRDSNFAAQLASSCTNKDFEGAQRKGKQSVQQLQQLVTELESIPDHELSDLSEKPKTKSVIRMTSQLGGGKVPIAAPKPSKSLSSFQKQQPLRNQSNSNPNIVFSVSISRPGPKQDVTSYSVPNSKSQSSLKTINENEKPSISSTSSSSIKCTQGIFPTEVPIRTENNTSVTKNTLNKEHNESEGKVSKNIFIPYNPNLNPNTTSQKNLYVDKQINSSKDKPQISSIPSIDIKHEKDTNLKSADLNSPEKRNGFAGKTDTSSDNLKPSWNVGHSFSRLNDEKKSPVADTKASLSIEPYRRNRSEDLRTAIEMANSSDSSKEGTGRGSVKPYRRSKSKDVTPAIEAVSDRISQLNSSTLRRISPFEAYRRSKSRELASTIDQVNSGSSDKRMKSPPPSEIIPKSDASMSQFEKAKTSIEKKFEKAKSPPLETEVGTTKDPAAKQIEEESGKDLAKANSTVVIDIPKEKEVEKDKSVSKELEKPKSMYKIITSKFSRSLSNVGEEKCDPTKQISKDEEEDNGEKDDKFRLRRPSRFLKSKMEKSSSRTSISEFDSKGDEEEDKMERKSSKKLSNALNKFLGRKPSTDDGVKKVLPTKSTSAAIIGDKTKRPPRFRSKMSSKSQENLNKNDENDAVEENHYEGRAKSVFPDTRKADEVTLESATKDICNHLSQIEINITSRIGNMSPTIVTPSKQDTSPVANTSFVSSDAPAGSLLTVPNKQGSCSQPSVTKRTSPLLLPDDELAARKRSIGDCSDDGSITPTTESGNESAYSGLEDIKETEDESVMDRITRKSYYSRFNEIKRKPKQKRVDTKEEMDQQLAAAKARLLQEEQQPNRRSIIRDSLTPTSVTPTAPSPTAQLDGIKKRNSKSNLSGSRTNSLAPEEGTNIYTSGVRSPTGHSPVPDESIKPKRHPSEEKENSAILYRSTPVNQQDKIVYRRQSSSNLDEATGYKRLSSSGKEDPSFYLRQPSVGREDQPSYRLPSHRSHAMKDETQGYKRLSSSNLDESTLGFKRLSSVPRDDFGYKGLTSSSSREDNQGYHTLQYRKPPMNDDSTYSSRYNSSYGNNIRDKSAWQPTRSERYNDSTMKSPSVSPSITLNQRNMENGIREGNSGKSEMWGAVASAAGRAAAEAAVAAVVSQDSPLDTSSHIPSPISTRSTAEAAAVRTAREELTRRLTPLTRLSNMGSGGGMEVNKARPYRRTVTSGSLPLGQSDIDKTPSVDRPSYKRTTTIDLPPTDSRIRTTDYRRVLHDPTRRFAGVRSSEDGSSSPVTPTVPSRTSPLSYSPMSPFPSSYTPPSITEILRRGSYR